MILAVCPNPCIDRTLEVEDLNVGRLTRIENKLEHCAGKACNAAIGVARLGGRVSVTGFMFEGGGKAFCQFLEKENIPSEFVWSKGSLRVNYKIIDEKSMLTELNDSGDAVSLKKQEELLSLLEKLSYDVNVTIISGSLPKGVDANYYYELTKRANGKTIVDCESKNLKAALKAGVYMVKPNLYELESFNNESYRTHLEMIRGCYKLLDAGAERVMLSMGRNGAILTDGTKNLYCVSESIAVNSTVGAGDSMVAAAALAIENDLSDEEILKRAVAAGTASVATRGTGLFTRQKYESILKNLTVSTIK